MRANDIEMGGDMLKALIMPNKYLQGRGVLRDLGKHASGLGRKFFIVGGPTAISCTREKIETSLQEEGMEYDFEVFRGECTQAEIDRLVKAAEDSKAEVLGAVGGGKVIDAAKATADGVGLPIVVIPTIASSDAPCSAVSVVYTEEGRVEKPLKLAKNPDLVLVDMEIIAVAPTRTLVAGMGDAMATKFEAEAAAGSFSETLAGGIFTQTSLGLARLCYDVLLEYGLSAKAAVERKAVTPSLDRVVEANILMSGIGFESSGVAAAHAISVGFTMLPRSKSSFHGEQVAFGTLAQLVMEGRDGNILKQVFGFCKSVGLPTNLDGLGLSGITKEELKTIAEKTCGEGMTVHNLGYRVEPQAVIDAILVVDELSKRPEFASPPDVNRAFQQPG